MNTLLALDIGTGGTKATLVTRSGQLIGAGYAEHETNTRAGNRIEQTPADWWRATGAAIAQLRQDEVLEKGQLCGITLSGQMQDLILLGDTSPHDHGAIGPAILYSDTRAQAEAQAISAQIGSDDLLRITGNTQDASSLLAKWRWLANHEPDRLAASHTLLLGAHSYVGWRMCGTASCDYTTAATTGLLDLHTNGWATELLERLGLNATMLPPLCPASQRIGSLTEEAAQQLQLPAALPVFAGAGDLAATTVGVGAGEPDRAYCYLGTSGWIATTLTQATPSTDGGIFTLRHPDPQRFIQVAPMLTAGGNLAWARSQVAAPCRGDDDYETINRMVAAAPTGSHGVLYLPHLAGERSPFRDPDARACYIGISHRTTRADLLRAVMEGVAYAYRSLLEALTTPPGDLVVAGGGAQSAVWMQILADVVGRTVHVVADPEQATARGAAIIAGRTLGWYDSYAPADLFPLAATYAPVTTSHQRYEPLYAAYQQLYPQLRGVFAQLAELQEDDQAG